MYPELHIGPLTLQTFGLMFALAFLAAGALIAKRLKEIGKPVDWAYELCFAGARRRRRRLARLLPRPELRQRQGRPARQPLLRLGPGLVRRRDRRRPRRRALGVVPGFLGLALLDLAAPALALGYAIGRCGCQLSGDGDYGKPWDGPWAMAYPDGTVPTDRTVHPTPVYETLAMGLGAWLLWQLRDRFRVGVLFAIYLLYAGAERFLVEFLRRNHEVALGLTAAQLESLAMMLAGGAWLLVVRARHGSLSEVSSTATITPATGL